MNVNRFFPCLPSLLTVVLAFVGAAGCVANTGAPDPDPSDHEGGPVFSAEGGPDFDSCGIPFEAGPGPDTGVPETGPCPVIEPVIVEGTSGAACFSAMQASCEPELKACAADCDCASLANACLTGSPALGVVACMSAGNSQATEYLYDCIYSLESCGAPPKKE
jgi:hypothetical protein